jgi:hypothetical protein
MKTITMFAALFLAVKIVVGQNDLKPVTTEFPLQWKTFIGNTSYKTNVQFTDSTLIIGSNGHHYNDYMLDDDFGVYVINRKNGKLISKIAGEGYGDMDVNGVLIHGNRLYFGNDNEEFLCTDLKGKIIWRKAVSGDIESEPVLIKNKNNNQIIYATETGEIRSINPKDGSTYWVYYDEKFDGWKPTDSRFIFKVKAYASSGELFHTKPILKDLNNDGVEDLIYNQYFSNITCINGVNGKLLHERERNGNCFNEMEESIWSGCYLSIERLKKGLRKTIEEYGNFGKSEVIRDLYDNKILLVNGKGKIVNSKTISFDISKVGLNSIACNNRVIFPLDDSIMIVSKDLKIDYISTYAPAKPNKSFGQYHRFVNMQIADKTFLYENFGECIITVSQFDLEDYNRGVISIVSIDKKKVVARFQLPSNSEFRPVINDVNQDGKLDLLINCRDGNLYCYSLGSQSQVNLVSR